MTTQTSAYEPDEDERTSGTDKAAFEAAVAAAVDARLKPLLEQFSPQHGAVAPEGDMQSFVRQLALGIAEISDQGTDRKRVAPEILAARADAHKRMVAAILEAKRASKEDGAERPKYRVTGKMYVDDQFIEPYVVDPATKSAKPVMIFWPGVPNQIMVPMNGPAREIHKHFLASIGSIEKVVADQPLWVSPGGLVIEGAPPMRREVSGVDFSGFDGGIQIEHNATDPTLPTINVLGTIAAPARQDFGKSAQKGA